MHNSSLAELHIGKEELDAMEGDEKYGLSCFLPEK